MVPENHTAAPTAEAPTSRPACECLTGDAGGVSIFIKRGRG